MSSLVYMLLELPLLVSNRPAQECQTGTWTERGYNPPAGRQGAEQLDLCPGYYIRLLQRGTPLPDASFPARQRLLLQGHLLSSLRPPLSDRASSVSK
ncbi:hypothetical protein VZT92_013383 [Zoarces viviparus]|uniref:Uncharacterized protein n=1 Tax=Zoarces viviparus TaxID=48416 RepID=A0AAW1F3Q0_ZOAVI